MNGTSLCKGVSDRARVSTFRSGDVGLGASQTLPVYHIFHIQFDVICDKYRFDILNIRNQSYTLFESGEQCLG